MDNSSHLDLPQFSFVTMSSGIYYFSSVNSNFHELHLSFYRTIDIDGNGYLDFKEFLMANDLIAAKTPEEKLKWTFNA